MTGNNSQLKQVEHVKSSENNKSHVQCSPLCVTCCLVGGWWLILDPQLPFLSWYGLKPTARICQDGSHLQLTLRVAVRSRCASRLSNIMIIRLLLRCILYSKPHSRPKPIICPLRQNLSDPIQCLRNDNYSFTPRNKRTNQVRLILTVLMERKLKGETNKTKWCSEWTDKPSKQYKTIMQNKLM